MAPQTGDKIRAPRFSSGKRIEDILGFIVHIDGSYHFIQVIDNPKYDVVELYSNEFEVLDSTDPDFMKIHDSQIKRFMEFKKQKEAESKRAGALMEALDIPLYNSGYSSELLIKAEELAKIFLNPELRKELISKLKMKAFW